MAAAGACWRRAVVASASTSAGVVLRRPAARLPLMSTRRTATTYRRWGDVVRAELPSGGGGGGHGRGTPPRLDARQRRLLRNGGVVLGVGGVFYVSNLETVPETGRRRFMVSSETMERAMGDQAEQQLRQEYGNRILPPNHPYSREVRRVADRILAVTQLGRGDADHPLKRKSDVKWQVLVVQDDDTPNAFVLPNGLIVVFTGILPVTRNEDGLATVLGHEIAHQIVRHSGERLSSQLVVSALVIGFSMMTGVDAGIGQMASRLLFELPNSRLQESEADQVGLELMARACFNPRESVALWQRMQQVSKEKGAGGIPGFLSTHPSDAKRVQNLSKLLPAALEQSDEFCGQAQGFRRAVFG